MLRQTLYNGTVTFNKMQYRKHPENGRRVSIIRPENEWIVVPIPELTIIDPDIFAEVQKALDMRSNRHLQRKLGPKVTTEEEKREISIKRSKEWRRNQAITTKRSNAVFGGKLYCGEHGHKITATYAKHYSCPVKGCQNRSLNYDQIMALVIDAISTLDQDTIRDHFDDNKMADTRAHHEQEIIRLKAELESLRASVNKVIEALGPDARSKDIRAFFDDKSEQIHRTKLDLARHKRELAETTLPKSLDRIILRHNALISKLRIWSRDPKAVVPLRRVIDKLTIHTFWDQENKTWRSECKATFDFNAIIASEK